MRSQEFSTIQISVYRPVSNVMELIREYFVTFYCAIDVRDRTKVLKDDFYRLMMVAAMLS